LSTTLGSLGIIWPIREGKENLLPGDIVIRRTNGTDMKPGLLVSEEGETFPDVDLNATADTATLGVALGEVFPANTYDIDDAFADNTWIYVLRKGGSRCVVSMLYEATSGGAVAGMAGDPVGQGAEDAGYIVALADVNAKVVGYLIRAVTGHATNVTVALVRWGL
jgi:hypothetical protein